MSRPIAGMTCCRGPDRRSPAARLAVPVRGPAFRACGGAVRPKQEIFLVGGQQAMDAFSDACEVAFDRLLPFLRRLAGTGHQGDGQAQRKRQADPIWRGLR